MDGRTQRPQFFKMLLPDFKLSIPPAFVDHIVDENHGKAVIFSNGKFWHVKIEEGDEGLCFGDGWEELVDSHDLQEGCYVVLRYEGNMVFTLKVFDKSMCRKYDFPLVGKGIKKRKACSRVDDKIPEDVTKTETPSPERHQPNAVKAPAPATPRSKEEYRLKRNDSRRRYQQLVTENKGLQFQKIIRPSNLLYAYMCVPHAFVELNGLAKSKVTNIKDPKGKLWPVRLCTGGKSPKFGKGWGNLAKGNNIEEGDVCAFNLVSNENNIVEVHIKKRSSA